MRNYVIRMAAPILALCLSVTTGHARIADTKDSAPAATGTLAMIKGQPLTAGQFNTFCELVAMTEGGMMEDQALMLEDHVLQVLAPDLYTTAAPENPVTFTPFAFQNQRAYLKQKLRMAIEKETTASREEMARWYDENSARYQVPERIHAHHIFMAVSKDEPSSAPDKVRARMAEARQQADKGTSFGLLAGKYSEAASAATGGDIGWVTYRMPLGPESRPMNIKLDTALFGLKPGQVSDIVQTSHGLHLMYAKDRTTTVTPTIDDLLTSGILPAAVSNQKVTSGIRETIAQTIDRLKIAAADSASAEPLTTATAAYMIGKDTVTIQQLEQLYGPRFTSIFARIKTDPERVKNIMQQAMDDEALVRAAMARGLHKEPSAVRDLETLAARTRMKEIMQRVVADNYTVTDEQAKQWYEEQKDRFRRPEAHGWVLSVKYASGSNTAERMKAQQEARKMAEAARERIAKGEDFEKVARELSRDECASSGGVVARHIVGGSEGECQRNFDQAIASLSKPGEIGPVVQVPDAFAVAKLGERFPGEPIPYEQVANNVKRNCLAQNQQKARTDTLAELEKRGMLKWMEGAQSFGKTPAKKK